VPEGELRHLAAMVIWCSSDATLRAPVLVSPFNSVYTVSKHDALPLTAYCR
jgi:hypothetical protein